MKAKLLGKVIILCMFLLIAFHYQGITSHAEEKSDVPNPVRIWRHSNKSLRLKWKKVEDAEGYIIYKYHTVKKKYIKHKTIKNKNTLIYIDKVGERTAAKYKVCAYKKIGKKKKLGKKSYYVRARTYRQGDKKVNAGKVEFKHPSFGDYMKNFTLDMAYFETQKIEARVKPTKYSKTTGKKPLSQKVRWYTSNSKIATVDKNGRIKAKTKAGKCSIYARANNGKKSGKITINVENYAKPDRNNLNLYPAYNNQGVYGFVLEMFTNYYDDVTDIAEYFSINRPEGKEVLSCEMEDGKIIMSPDNYVTGEIKQKIYSLVNDFPYDMRITIAPNVIKIREKRWGSDGKMSIGVTVTFTYDKNNPDGSEYTESYKLATNWNYGYFVGV